jgi:uncharacterized protein YecE (DUF72 family)
MVPAKVLVGMGGWDLPPFNRRFYPFPKPKDFSKLEFYSRYFDLVEVNSTFYNPRWDPAIIRRWLTDVSGNKNFLFTVKLYRGFTHERIATQGDLRSIHEILDLLVAEGKLGGLVIQLPFSFTCTADRRRHLEKISRAFRDYTMFIEVRHDSWNSPDIDVFFREHSLHQINIDLPPLKHYMPLTSVAWDGVSYFRMMGRNSATWTQATKGAIEENGSRYNYLYNQDELDQLLKLIQGVRNNTKRVFVVFHNDPNAHSLVNGFQIRKHLKQPVSVPPSLTRIYPQLGSPSVIREEGLPLFEERQK